MPDRDDHELERRLRDQRPEASDEFVQSVAARVRSSRHPSARPRLTLAFALSLALLVSLAAFGGVGAASNALHSSASAVKTAVGGDKNKPRGGKSKGTPAHSQYHGKVNVCYPKVSHVVAYETVTKYRWVWKWNAQKKKRVKVKVAVLVKVKVRTKTITYVEKTVSASQLAKLTAKGAIYPVPRDGCASAGQQT